VRAEGIDGLPVRCNRDCIGPGGDVDRPADLVGDGIDRGDRSAGSHDIGGLPIRGERDYGGKDADADMDRPTGCVGGGADRDDRVREESDGIDGLPGRVDRNAKGRVAGDVDRLTGCVGGGADRDDRVTGGDVEGLAVRRGRYRADGAAHGDWLAWPVAGRADRDERSASGPVLEPDVDGRSGRPVMCRRPGGRPEYPDSGGHADDRDNDRRENASGLPYPAPDQPAPDRSHRHPAGRRAHSGI
jgi:hypothetical protein